MSLIKLTTMLATAKQYHFAVGAFNAIDSHFVDAIFAAAEANRSPFPMS
jgi:fructose-bisphosphate aldolase class II